jgi:toxin CcdB
VPQFTVYENINEETREIFPYLVDVQNDLLSDLNTRVVIPMCISTAFGNKPISNLSPVFEIKGSNYLLLTQQLASIPTYELGPPICNLSEFRHQFINALDFLFTGF